MSEKQYEPGTLGHMLRLPYTEPTPPASQESAGKARSRLRERAQNEATSIALQQMLNERDKTIATLTAELAAMQEQRDSLRDECERLREALHEIAEWTERYTTPGHPISTVARAALSASGREDKSNGR